MHEDWMQTDATVASAIEYHTKAGPMYSVTFTYKVNGSWLGGTFTTSTDYMQGDPVAMRYDPSNPERNNLAQREKLHKWASILFFVLLVSLFVYMLFAGK